MPKGAEEEQSILTPHSQPRERQSLKAVEFLWLHWLSFPIPQLWAWSVRRWHLFCPDAKGEGCGGEGLASSGWLLWDCRGMYWRACEVLGAWCWGFASRGWEGQLGAAVVILFSPWLCNRWLEVKSGPPWRCSTNSSLSVQKCWLPLESVAFSF